MPVRRVPSENSDSFTPRLYKRTTGTKREPAWARSGVAAQARSNRTSRTSGTEKHPSPTVRRMKLLAPPASPFRPDHPL